MELRTPNIAVGNPDARLPLALGCAKTCVITRPRPSQFYTTDRVAPAKNDLVALLPRHTLFACVDGSDLDEIAAALEERLGAFVDET
jgi:hypothetical protein